MILIVYLAIKLSILILIGVLKYFSHMNSQTRANDHLTITTTYLQRPLFEVPAFQIKRAKEPLNNDHPSTTFTIFWIPTVVVVHRFDCTAMTNDFWQHTYVISVICKFGWECISRSLKIRYFFNNLENFELIVINNKLNV